MGALIGGIIGAFIATFLLGSLLNWALFKRLSVSPTAAALLSAGSAIVLALVIAGFGNADAGPWNPGNGYIIYGIGGLLSGAVLYFRARKAEQE